MKGPMVGHFSKEIKTAVVSVIKEVVDSGMTQKSACETFGINPRKFRRWVVDKHRAKRVAWNRILPSERDAIVKTAWDERFLDKPISHMFVHGQESGDFYASIPTIYRVLKKESITRQIHKPRKSSYVSIHDLLNEGFSLLCYDATRFVTDTNVTVWAIPVLLLPCRYLLHIGYSLVSVTTNDLTNTVKDAYASIPETMLDSLIAHSDRGSAMKSRKTKHQIENLLGLPVHYGRPYTPDDQAWIEAFIKTLKYHRDIPSHFPQVDDVVQWFIRFPDIYNNEPHSSLSYVTPTQALLGKKEVILAQRKSNLLLARNLRLLNYKTSKSKTLTAVSDSGTIVIGNSV